MKSSPTLSTLNADASHHIARTPSDAALVARARAGDAAAFDELMSRHNAALFRTALAIVRSSEDAEEVTQNAWIRAYQHLARFAGTSSIRTWLVAITRNAAIDHRRRALRQQPWRWIEHNRMPLLTSELVSQAPSPEDLLLKTEQRDRMTRSMNALPSRLRLPLRLWYGDQYSYAEMAAKAGVPLGTLKSRIWEARQQLLVLCQMTVSHQRLRRKVS